MTSVAFDPADPSKPAASCVYGPVTSWRVGASLGIDLLFQTSICSFNCIYCQLGEIQQKTRERQLFVPTEDVQRDLQASPWQEADIVTFSGNGEPTLALNLGEAIKLVKSQTGKPVMVLTNGTLLQDAAVRADLAHADQVAVKLDAATDAGLRQMNRPVDGIALAGILEGTRLLRAEYRGKLALQCMFMPTNRAEAEGVARLAATLAPDEIQLNTPKRPYPREWHRESRGNHGNLPYPSARLAVLTPEQAAEVEAVVKQYNQTSVISIYR